MSIKVLLAKPLKRVQLTCFFFITLLLGTNIVSAKDKDIEIKTTSHGYYFEVGNLKPGDWMPRDITILNQGKQDFRYTAQIGKKKSVKGLFEELDLLVKKNSDILFEGKLKDFEAFTPRKLAKGSSEQLFFQVSMPYNLGNAFQDSSAEVEIIFLAEALTDPSDPPGDGEPSDESNDEGAKPGDSKDNIVINPEMTKNLLPNTATNTYNLLLIGGLLLGTGSVLILVFYRRIRSER